MVLGWATSELTMLEPSGGETAQASDAMSGVSPDAIAMSSGPALKSFAAAPDRPSRMRSSASSSKASVPSCASACCQSLM